MFAREPLATALHCHRLLNPLSQTLLFHHEHPQTLHPQIMGFVGAVGLTPLCFVMPVVLHLVAHGGGMPRMLLWFNVALATAYAGCGALATVGSVRSIVVAIQDHEFFS